MTDGEGDREYSENISRREEMQREREEAQSVRQTERERSPTMYNSFLCASPTCHGTCCTD
jgi:hypothetical protein